MAGSKGLLYVFSDFLGTNTSAAVLGPDIQAYGVGSEAYTATVDEPGGILALATGGSDNDNALIRTGPFRIADGGMSMEARFKYSDVDCAIFVGFTETLDTTTPVMPAEFATATMTYNGSGGMVGIQYDADGTTDDFRAVLGDAGVAKLDSSNGIRANATVTADGWFIARVVVYPDASAEVWLADQGHVATGSIPSLRLIKKFAAGGLTTTDLFFATVMIETRSGNARTCEIDYFEVQAARDWATT